MNICKCSPPGKEILEVQPSVLFVGVVEVEELPDENFFSSQKEFFMGFCSPVDERKFLLNAELSVVLPLWFDGIIINELFNLWLPFQFHKAVVMQ